MPVSFLTEAERERLSRFPAQVLPEDLITFFTLSDSDKVEVLKQRGDHNRLGFALQLCMSPAISASLQTISIPFPTRWWTSSPVNWKSHPRPSPLDGRRIPTRTAHLQQVQAYLAFRKATPLDWEILAAWLLERALEHDKPMLLLQLACEKLLRDRIVRPGISRLERMVATARQDAQKETFRRLASLLEQERRTFLDQLLIPDQMGRTPLTWLREGAKSNSAEEILNAVKKLDFLREAGVEGWDMTTLNPNRLKFLAGESEGKPPTSTSNGPTKSAATPSCWRC